MTSAVPFPAHRVYLSRQVIEPSFSSDGRHLFYALVTDARLSLRRLDLETGFEEVVSAEPTPAGQITYGGGLFTVHGDQLVYSGKDCKLHHIDLRTGEQRAISPAFEALGAPGFSSCGRFILCAIESQSCGQIVLLPADGSELPCVLGPSLSFAIDPCIAPDGSYAAWQSWNETQMPWDQSELRIARFALPLSQCKSVHDAFPIALSTLSKPKTHIAFPLPSLEPNELIYVSDESGWRNPWILNLQTQERRQLATIESEVGSPNWVQRMMPMGLGSNGKKLYAISKREGESLLLCIDLRTGEVKELKSVFRSLNALAVFDGLGQKDDQLAYLGSSPQLATHLVTRSISPDGTASAERHRLNTSIGVWAEDRHAPCSKLTFKAKDGTDISGVFTRCLDAENNRPQPLIVVIHGGPTSCAEFGYDPTAQFYATRGYHYLAINHRGSTQCGRAFQDLLCGNWGDYDVEDARCAAEYLVTTGVADRDRLAIMGGSAGGFTTLLALTKDTEFWSAGIALYGVGDLYELMIGSHRFEKRYQDILVGPLPDAAARWLARSPLSQAKKLKAPLLLFHGMKDKAVPAQQSLDFASAAKRAGAIAEVITYEEEGHGFRQEKNRKDQLERSISFLNKYLRYKQFTS